MWFFNEQQHCKRILNKKDDIVYFLVVCAFAVAHWSVTNLTSPGSRIFSFRSMELVHLVSGIYVMLSASILVIIC